MLMRLLTIIFLLYGLLASRPGMAFPLQLPASASSSGNTPLEQARRSFMGKDLVGKDGPMAKIGPDLILTFHEHRDYLARGGLPKLKHKFKPSHPLMRAKDDTVVVDIVAQDDVNKLKADLKALGMEDISVFGRFISGRLPITALDSTAGLQNLRFARPAYAMTRTGSVTSQGDAAMLSNIARTSYSVDGSGIIVGTLSDSYNCKGGAAGDVTSNDLPTTVVVLQEESGCGSGTDEGRAMMQIIHDVAPGASQAFHTAFGGVADFANGIIELATVAGADVINDDVFYYAEPMFQDGPIAQAIDTVKGMGVSYFSAAGNQARKSYESTFLNSGQKGYRARSKRHDFISGTGTDTLQSISIPNNSQVIFVFQWEDPFFSVSGSPGSDTDMDIVLYSSGGTALAGGIDLNIGNDAVEIFAYTNISGATETYQIGLEHVSGPAPSTIKYVYFGSMTISEYTTNSGSSYGHAIAAGARAVGAARYTKTPAFGVSPPQLESFSSAGGIQILFDTSGNPVSESRQKPEIVAPDGGDNTFFGSDYESNGWPNFFGTSAAAPHAAGVAALLKEFDPALSPDDLYTALQSTAIDMGSAGIDNDSGYGLIQADQALASLDTDGDGLSNTTEVTNGTDPNKVDTDGDGLADGADGIVPLAALPGGIDADGDGFVDGEQDLGTSPLTSNVGDLAPRGMPNDQLDTGDLVVLTRLVTGIISPSTLESALADINGDSLINVADLLLLQQALTVP